MDSQLLPDLDRGLTEVPPKAAAAPIASALRAYVGADESQRLDLDQLLELSDTQISTQNLGGGEGGPQGLLLPRPNGGFRVEVDPAPPDGWDGFSYELREEITRHRFRFTALHEVAHTLFYRREPGRPPERLVKGSQDQEDFCDPGPAINCSILASTSTKRHRPPSVL
jgi:hypothetical protein